MQREMFLRVSTVMAMAAFLPAVSSIFHPYVKTPLHVLNDASSFYTTGNHKPMPSLVIDTFQNAIHNDLGFWHGTGEDLKMEHEPGYVRLFPTDPDQNFHTQFDAQSCFSLLPWRNQFLHVVFEGSEEFTVSLNEHNSDCYPRRSPFPGVPDSVQASRYLMRTTRGTDRGENNNKKDDVSSGPGSSEEMTTDPGHEGEEQKGGCNVDVDDSSMPASPEKTDLFIPLSHFQIDQSRVVSVSFTGFYTNEPLTLRRIEIVPTIPPPAAENNNFHIPEKLSTGTLVLRCKKPNSFAFGIDDGQPRFAQEVMRILDEEDVRATFFVVGAGLRDHSTNFTNFYKEMMKRGHQIALHSNTHPKMESLPTLDQIDDEIQQTLKVFNDELGIQSHYFRPPFGTVGARMRQRLALYISDPQIVNWSVDVEDWLWANTSTPEKQLDAFYRGIARGGNLAVMHYLNRSTVEYLPQFIRHAKDAGLKIMRIDQCLEDPLSPAL